MSIEEMAALRPFNPSMGLMLENVSPRLLEPGMPHFNCPDKDPALRLATIANAGQLRVPFTSGILVGIGETNAEIVDSLLALSGCRAAGGDCPELSGEGEHPHAQASRTASELVRSGRGGCALVARS